MGRTWVAAARGLVSFCLSGMLVACGGGGGSNPPPASQTEGDGSWRVQQLSTSSANLYPGNTYQPIGGEAGYAFWVGGSASNRTLNISDPAAMQRGVVTRVLMDGLPNNAASNTTVAVLAGQWSMITWTESASPDQNLFIRLKGAAFDSGAVLVSTQFQGAAWDVRLVVDQTGNARAIWDEPGRQGANGLFSAGVWVPQADIGVSLAYLQRYLVGPDGQGWLFRSTNGGAADEVRRITAAGGVGASQLLGASGGSSSNRLASEEGPESFQTLTYQYPSFLIRRMVNGTLQPQTSLLAYGSSEPNENYVSFDSDESGRAVLVWSTGTNDTALYVARRSAAGGWSTPVKLADLPTNAYFSLLSGLKVVMGPQGQALVVYRTQAVVGAGNTAWALVAQDGGAWPAPVELARTGYSNSKVAIEFSAAGTPGVLQLISGSSDAGVLMSTWRSGVWATESLRSNTQLSYIYSTLLSSIRLAPHGANGWLASWDEGWGPGSIGHRDLWVAEYR